MKKQTFIIEITLGTDDSGDAWSPERVIAEVRDRFWETWHSVKVHEVKETVTTEGRR